MDSLFADRFKDVSFPVRVHYCGECSLPTEYCSFYPTYEKCKAWLERNLPDEFERLCGVSTEPSVEGEDKAAGDGNYLIRSHAEGSFGFEVFNELMFIFVDGKKSGRQKRGGKGMVKSKKKTEVERHIGLIRSSRAKKKILTIVIGLSTYGIDLKEASKFFSSKFACGSSIVENDVIIQGDVKDELFDILPDKWPEIDEDSIEDLGDRKG